MADACTTKIGREKLCKAHAGDRSLPKLTYIAYGDGGTDEEGNVIEPTGEETELRHELLRQEIDGHHFPIETTCEYTSGLSKEALANCYLSEYGIFDEENDLIIYKSFLKKGKDEDMLFEFDIQEIF